MSLYFCTFSSLATLRSAVLFCKSLTLVRTHWPESDAVTARNRRMGVSVSGVAQFLAKHGEMELVRWLEAGYGEVQQLDAQYSAWLRVPQSIKTTCVKPSGTVSLLAGATPGAHFPISRFYIRRVRTDSLQAAKFRALGYPTEPEAASGAGAQQSSRWVVEIPVDCGYTGDCGSDVSMVQQLELAALLQRHWADNQVSCTVTFDPLTEGPQLPAALERFETQLKGVSFLPRCSGAYKQMPYEEISEAEYKRRLANIRAE
jgi:ribonucleotide reductase alpha subunit